MARLRALPPPLIRPNSFTVVEVGLALTVVMLTDTSSLTDS
jgi:hypothetical protein